MFSPKRTPILKEYVHNPDICHDWDLQTNARSKNLSLLLHHLSSLSKGHQHCLFESGGIISRESMSHLDRERTYKGEKYPPSSKHLTISQQSLL